MLRSVPKHMQIKLQSGVLNISGHSFEDFLKSFFFGKLTEIIPKMHNTTTVILISYYFSIFDEQPIRF